MLILNNIANNIGRLTNATLGRTALHCIKMCSICHVGADYISFAPIFYKSERAHAAAPPFQITPALLGCDLIFLKS